MRETKQKKETNVVSTSKREKDKHVNKEEKEKCQEHRERWTLHKWWERRKFQKHRDIDKWIERVVTKA